MKPMSLLFRATLAERPWLGSRGICGGLTGPQARVEIFESHVSRESRDTPEPLRPCVRLLSGCARCRVDNRMTERG
jgi:hypothetical protein